MNSNKLKGKVFKVKLIAETEKDFIFKLPTSIYNVVLTEDAKYILIRFVNEGDIHVKK